MAQNQVAEWGFESKKIYENAFTDIEVKAVFTAPNGTGKVIPAFWGGGFIWKIRYSSPLTGLHKFRLVCSDTANKSMHEQTGELEVTVYQGENPLYKHGNLQMAAERSYLQHEDGQTFFAAMPNSRINQIRLSRDFRYQPVSDIIDPKSLESHYAFDWDDLYAG